jgi:hypothetical protein
MPMEGRAEALSAIEKLIRDIGDPSGEFQTRYVAKVVASVREILREEFATGEGPYGKWQPTASGKPALISKKLPQAFTGEPAPGGAVFYSRIPWLRAHHTGHVFAARTVGENKQFLSFSKQGKLVAERKIFNRKGEVKKGAYQRFARAHAIGKRVLPARPIYPNPGRALPEKWARAIGKGAEEILRVWASKAKP